MSYLIERLNDRREKGGAGADAAFTLIELMVVLLIMAILLAIAIPTFLGVSGSANDRAAQSNLNTALTNAKSYYDSNSQTFGTTVTATLLTSLGSQEPSISWTSGSSTGSGVISVGVASDGNGIILSSLSKTGVCWFLVDNESTETTGSWTQVGTVPSTQVAAGTWYGGGKLAAPTNCGAAAVNGATNWNASGVAGFPSV
jgi:type IV pilus assembly protein PilA